MLLKILIQIAGQCSVLALIYFWLGIGVGTVWQIALNAALAICIVLALAALDAYGLGNVRHTLWAIPAVLSVGLLYWKVPAAVVVILLWLVVLLPSAARARWSIHASPRYLGMGAAILAVGVLPAIAFLSWVPKFEGLGLELTSFILRAALAAVFFFGAWALLLDFVRRETLAPKTEDPLPSVPPQQPLHT
jgi:hypothetical protein